MLEKALPGPGEAAGLQGELAQEGPMGSPMPCLASSGPSCQPSPEPRHRPHDGLGRAAALWPAGQELREVLAHTDRGPGQKTC